MRQKARKCPLCDVYMTGKPNQLNSKHLDHILPISQGGTHTHGNVRIICADCNLHRPKDGSDYTGTLSLWAQGPVPLSRRDKGTCGKGLHPWIPANIKIESNGKKKCKPCCRARQQVLLRQCRCGTLFPAPGRTFMCPDCVEATARRAAELHASGLNWGEVAAEVGYGTAEGARYAAKRIGYVPAPKPVKAEPQRLCPDCGTPEQKRDGKGQFRCEHCTTAKAWRAVEMRSSGMTTRAIADELGYDSITTVTNLMKTVVTVSSTMGRPKRGDAYFIKRESA